MLAAGQSPRSSSRFTSSNVKRLWSTTRVVGVVLGVLVASACSGSAADVAGPSAPVQETQQQPRQVVEQTPSFLRTGWIWPINGFYRTYDFNLQTVGGVSSIEVRNWQQIGSLGGQSSQIYRNATFAATSRQLVIATTTGYVEAYEILQVSATEMLLRDTAGNQVIWYNCRKPGWPDLIHASVRSCN